MISTVIITSITIYLIFGIYLFFNQRNLLYFQTESLEHDFEEKIFINKNTKIKTTILNKGNKNSIIYFGGNSEIVDYNAEHFVKFFPNYSIYLVKYRGYSGSEGITTEKNMYNDALYIFDELKSNYEKFIVIGRSIGSGVATYLASKRDIEKLILVTPFDSVQNVAQKIFPIYPMSIILKDKHNSIQRVQDIKAKTLIIVAQNDKVVKPNHTDRLFNKFRSAQVVFLTIKGVDHNNISKSEEYHLVLQNFIENCN